MKNKKRISAILGFIMVFTTAFGTGGVYAAQDTPEFPVMEEPVSGADDAICEQAEDDEICAELPVREKLVYGTPCEGETLGVSADEIKEREEIAWNKAQGIVSANITEDMTQEEIAVTLHDYLIANCRYATEVEQEDRYSFPADADYDPLYNSAYGALVEECALSGGYSDGFRFLLGAAGIEAKVLESATIYYYWNHVKIDGEWYNADCMLDDRFAESIDEDTAYVYTGKVRHDFLLLSDDALTAALTELREIKDPQSDEEKMLSDEMVRNELDMHTTEDGEDECTEDTFDDAFWRSVRTCLVYRGDGVYYGTAEEATPGMLRNIAGRPREGGEEEVFFDLKKLCHNWGSGNLFAYNGFVYFSTPKFIYKFDPDEYSEEDGYKAVTVYKNETDKSISYIFFRDGSGYITDQDNDTRAFDLDEVVEEEDPEEKDKPSPAVPQEEIDRRDEAADKAADNILENLISEEITEEEELAIALHDYLVMSCEYYVKVQDDPVYYDVDNEKYDPIYQSAYGALVERKALDGGYARAYQLLLDKAGIESALVSSAENVYDWNRVKLGGKWYNVDCCMDDRADSFVNSRETSSQAGRIQREYLLLSDETLVNKCAQIHKDEVDNHTSDDQLTPCNDKHYENKYWRSVNSPLVYLDDFVYYCYPFESEGVQETIVARISRVTGKSERVFAFEELIKIADPSGLFLHEGMIYFNNANYILKFDPNTVTATAYVEAQGVFKRGDKDAEIRYIYMLDGKGYYSDEKDEIHEFDLKGSVKYVKSGVQEEGKGDPESNDNPVTSGMVTVLSGNSIKMMKGVCVSVTRFPGVTSGNYIPGTVSVNVADPKIVNYNPKKGILKFKKPGTTTMTVGDKQYNVTVVKPVLTMKKGMLSVSDKSDSHDIEVSDTVFSYGTVKLEVKYSNPAIECSRQIVDGGIKLTDIDMDELIKGSIKINIVCWYVNPLKDKSNTYDPTQMMIPKMEKKLKIGTYKLSLLRGSSVGTQ